MSLYFTDILMFGGRDPYWFNGHTHTNTSRIDNMIKYRRLRWVGHVDRMEEGRATFKILTGKATGKRPLVLTRRSWEDNFRT